MLKNDQTCNSSVGGYILLHFDCFCCMSLSSSREASMT